MKITITWGHVNPKPGFVSAWDAARNAYGRDAKETDTVLHDSEEASPYSGELCSMNQRGRLLHILEGQTDAHGASCDTRSTWN